MARQLEVNGKRYWILSDRQGSGWQSTVLEILDADGRTTSPLGIEATAETRGAADDAAERELRRMVKESA
jgi:hypothetical protein